MRQRLNENNQSDHTWVGEHVDGIQLGWGGVVCFVSTGICIFVCVGIGEEDLHVCGGVEARHCPTDLHRIRPGGRNDICAVALVVG